MTFSTAEQPKRIIPRLVDIQQAGEAHRLVKEREVLLQAVAAWSQAILRFTQTVEAMDFQHTLSIDAEPLTDLPEYQALKELVTLDAPIPDA